ncbi:MAG: DUF4399 domain-containing protein [Deltaproteobacteria bacterium]|nr:DUF4399 domain-containing protein [Deltaproteobacteria bacterium]
MKNEINGKNEKQRKKREEREERADGAATCVASLLVLSLATSACTPGDSGLPPSKIISVELTSPLQGGAYQNPVHVKMDATGVVITPSSKRGEGYGYFVLAVDAPCTLPAQEIPVDDQHLHFVNGESEAFVVFSWGEHELCLEVADEDLRAYDGADMVSIYTYD